MMNLSDLDVTTVGIQFSVQPTYRFGNQRTLSARTCFVSNQTLDRLAERHHSKNHLPEQIFREFESEITGIAETRNDVSLFVELLIERTCYESNWNT